VRCPAGFAIAVIALACLPAHAEVLEKTRMIAGLKVEYRVVLPERYNPSMAYPAILMFGGGSQDIAQADNEIKRTWRTWADQRGYIVVLPAAPGGDLFFEGGARIFPEFLKTILSEYKIADGKFNIAGHSNGGISAFHIAASYPQYFVSITGYPGYLPDATPARLRAISKMCIFMFAGGLDPDWAGEMDKQSQIFRAQGMSVKTAVEPGQPHRIATLQGDGAKRLFDQFDEARKGCSK
jgi:poly(3-hydroxybutyrate) depolymerase